MTRRVHRVFAVVVSVVLLSCFVIAGCPAPAPPEVIELNFATMFYPQEMPSLTEQHWCNLVEEKTEGRVKINYYSGGTLGTPPELLPLVREGAADLASVSVVMFPAEMPLHWCFEQPAVSSQEEFSAACNALEFDIPETAAILGEEARHLGVKLLFWHANSGYGVMTRFPANTLAELEGKKVGVVGPVHGDICGEFGMTSVFMMPPEYYESLARGVVDAEHGGAALFSGLKVYEVAKSFLATGDTQGFCPLLINLDRWETLPADVQEAMVSASKEAREYETEVDAKFVSEAFELWRQSGVTIIEALPTEEKEKWSTARLAAVTKYYMGTTTDAGVADKAEVVLKQLEKFLQEHK